MKFDHFLVFMGNYKKKAVSSAKQAIKIADKSYLGKTGVAVSKKKRKEDVSIVKTSLGAVSFALFAKRKSITQPHSLPELKDVFDVSNKQSDSDPLKIQCDSEITEMPTFMLSRSFGELPTPPIEALNTLVASHHQPSEIESLGDMFGQFLTIDRSDDEDDKPDYAATFGT